MWIDDYWEILDMVLKKVFAYSKTKSKHTGLGEKQQGPPKDTHHSGMNRPLVYANLD